MKKDTIQYEDFQKVDMRVGEILEVVPVENSEKLLELTVDFGEDYGTVTILSGIAKFYTPEDIKGKKVVFCANLEPRKMMGKVSNGMILAVDDPEKPSLLFVDSCLKNGSSLR